MKKIFAYFLPVLVLSMLLCGCGRNKVKDEVVVTTPTPTPTVTVAPSASMMPEIENGIVEDSNGIIGDESIVDKENDKITVSPDPSLSPSPSATTKP